MGLCWLSGCVGVYTALWFNRRGAISCVCVDKALQSPRGPAHVCRHCGRRGEGDRGMRGVRNLCNVLHLLLGGWRLGGPLVRGHMVLFRVHVLAEVSVAEGASV